MPATEKLKLTAIQVDWSVQPRANGLDQSHVDELADAYRSEDRGEVPPPVVWLVNGVYKLSQGFHRVEAAKRAGLATLSCTVEKGDEIAWKIDAACSNKDHGLKRTNADKRRAVAAMLAIDESYSDRLIAEMVLVSASLVADVRKEHSNNNQLLENAVDDTSKDKPKEKRKGKDGKTRTAKPKKPAKDKPAAPKDSDPLRGGNNFDFGANAKAEEAEPVKAEADPLNDPDAFVAEMETVCRQIDVYLKQIRYLEKSKYAKSVMLSTAIDQIEAARKQLWVNRPAYPCEYCQGKEDDCRACRGTGRLAKDSYKRACEALGKEAAA